MTPASNWKYNSVNSSSLARCSGVNCCCVTAWTSASNWSFLSSVLVPAGHSTAVSAANSRSSPQARRFRRMSGRAMTRKQTHVGGQNTSSCIYIFFGVVWPGEAFGTLSLRKKANMPDKHMVTTLEPGWHTQHTCLGIGTESCRHDNKAFTFDSGRENESGRQNELLWQGLFFDGNGETYMKCWEAQNLLKSMFCCDMSNFFWWKWRNLHEMLRSTKSAEKHVCCDMSIFLMEMAKLTWNAEKHKICWKACFVVTCLVEMAGPCCYLLKSMFCCDMSIFLMEKT